MLRHGLLFPQSPGVLHVPEPLETTHRIKVSLSHALCSSEWVPDEGGRVGWACDLQPSDWPSTVSPGVRAAWQEPDSSTEDAAFARSTSPTAARVASGVALHCQPPTCVTTPRTPPAA